MKNLSKMSAVALSLSLDTKRLDEKIQIVFFRLHYRTRIIYMYNSYKYARPIETKRISEQIPP